MKLGKCSFKLNSPIVMGICNVTPDSFSDGGRSFKKKDALNNINMMLKNGCFWNMVENRNVQQKIYRMSFRKTTITLFR